MDMADFTTEYEELIVDCGVVWIYPSLRASTERRP